MKCQQCQSPFSVTDEDRKFYDKISPTFNGHKYQIPEPILCPECRHIKRLTWRNERFLHHATCNLCQKKIISMYSQNSPFPIYCPDCFWSDKWNPLDYSRDFDFNRPFFEQFKGLLDCVPQLSIAQANSVNSEYTVNSVHNKNCYLTSGADYNEDSMYGINTQRSKNCVDHYLLYDSELCYGCLDSTKLHNCIGCQECENLSDCLFLYDSKGCEYCAFSSNLRNKKYVIFNEQVSKEEYEIKLKNTLDHLFKNYNWLFDALKKVRSRAIHRSNLVINSEHCTGNYIRNCKNAKYVFDVEDMEDCSYCFYGLGTKNSYDINCTGWCTGHVYNSMSIAYGNNIFLSSSVYRGNDLFYSRCIWNSSNLFGSTSLHKQNKYVILNKQYSKDEYKKLVPNIIEYMQSTGEWGQFFPPSIAPFEYNRSMAIDYYPDTKVNVTKKGFKWSDEEGKKSTIPSTYKLPNSISDTSDDVVGQILSCKRCQQNYRIIAQELNFHKKMNLPLPKFCWPCRLQELIKARKPAKLFENICKKCEIQIQTPYSPDRPEKVYCEDCYLKEVY